MKTIKLVKRSINSKHLFREINEVITDAIVSLEVKWTSEAHRSSFIELMGDYLLDIEDDGRIEQSKVICDQRNNNSFSTLTKEYIFEIRYRQKGCLNITSLEYHIQNQK